MLFRADFEVLLYDMTSSYFECNPPKAGKRRFGHSRDHRSDCVQVVIALIVTPEGCPLAYEMVPEDMSRDARSDRPRVATGFATRIGRTASKWGERTGSRAPKTADFRQPE
jgi:hypothetical protein